MTNLLCWRVALRVLFATICLFLLSVIFTWYQIEKRPLNVPAEGLIFELAPGSSLRMFAKQLHQAKVLNYPSLLRFYTIIKGQANKLQAGEYQIIANSTAKQFLNKVVNGEVTQYAFTIVEGWKTSELISALHTSPKMRHKLHGLNEQEIIQQLQIPEAHLEGIFLPDTYYYTANTSDIDFLRRAYFNMQEKMQLAWSNRSQDCRLKSSYEALILASIIEKESGIHTEYHEISGVFHRRLAKKMRLQSDPTVIYALGEKYKNNLAKKHLRIDSPYNTYVKHGLPPTPIALPGIGALEAALNPAKGDSLYFVATGDGGHVFSRDLLGHNKAVKKYRERINGK